MVPKTMIAFGASPEPPPSTVIERSLDLLFPPRCLGCGRIGKWICGRCWDSVPWTGARRCDSCGRLSLTSLCPTCLGFPTVLDGTIATTDFDGIAREAVHALKYHGRHAISALMGGLMAGAAHGAQADLVVPVPLHRARRRERGYDQSVLLARHLARALGTTLQTDALVRTRRTAQQVKLDGEDRRKNVAGAFAMARPLHGDRILLVDDVLTTGATMEAAASALKEGGAVDVWAVVFSHAQ